MNDKGIEAAIKAAQYWHSPEGNIQGFWQIYEGGSLHSTERDGDVAADKVCALNAQAAIAAYLAQCEADGEVMVPVEPDKAMLQAGNAWTNHHADCVDSIYRAMIATRPKVAP